jgi:hypothetical protein|nr:MAG TPA: minor structural protein [Caudoviricetes sp.]
MTLQELLTQNGIAEETIIKILNGMKENKIFTASEENLDVRYGKLKDEHTSKLTELEQANNLIGELKKSAKGNEDLEGKIKTYETETIPQLQKQLEETKIKSAIKLSLLGEKAVDVDYLTYKLEEKLKENGETLQLDDNENIKGWSDKLASLKTQFPKMFESSQRKTVDPNTLPEPDNSNKGLTKADIFKMSYADRAKYQSENPEEYKTIMKS